MSISKEKDPVKVVEAIMTKAEKSGRKYLEAGKIEPISEEWPFNNIGVYLFVGPMQSGKTYMISKHILIADQMKLYPSAIFVTDTPKTDQTLETFAKKAKNTNIVEIKSDKILEVLDSLLKRKKKYYALYKAFMSELKDIDEEAQRVFKKHKLKTASDVRSLNSNVKQKLMDKTMVYIAEKCAKYNTGDYPIRTLVVLDDAAGSELLRGRNPKLVQLMKACRHYHFTFIICVQGSIDVTPDIKRIVTDVVLYKRIPQHDIEEISKKISMPIAPDDLIRIHGGLKNTHGYIQININAGIVKIVDP